MKNEWLCMETKREKRLRYFLVAVFVSITIGALFYKYNGIDQAKRDDPVPLVIVIEGSSEKDNPVVIMYDFREPKHILAQYEIERNHDYRFKTLHAVEIKQAVTDLEKDRDEGVWVKISGKWHYFDQDLQPKKRSLEYKSSTKPIPYTEVQTEDGKWIVLGDGERVKVEVNEIVRQVLPLSIDQRLWLILTNHGVKISTIDTK